MAPVQELRRGFQVGAQDADGGVDAGGSLGVDAGTVYLSGTLESLPTTTQAFNVRASEFEALALAAHPTAVLREHVVDMGALPGLDTYGTYVSWPDLALGYNRVPGQALITPVFEYANPFPARWRRFVTSSAVATVSYAAPLADGTSARPASFSVLSYAQEPLADGVTPTLAPKVGPARHLRLNGLSATERLSGVGQTPVVSWDAPSLGVPTSYAVRVYRLFASSGSTRRTLVGTFTTSGQTQVRLPPGVLTAGQSYYIHLTAYLEPGFDPLKPFLSRPVSHSAAAATGLFQP
jgi:hypothetical protein